MSISSSSWSCKQVPEDKYEVYQRGSHADGSFIQVYVPESAANSGTKQKAIVYLHGFALCLPSFYEAHIISLVKEGYIVFFPDFQRSLYPNTFTLPKAIPPKPDQDHLRRWWSVANQSLEPTPSDTSLSTNHLQSLFSEAYPKSDTGLGDGLSEFSAKELKRVARSLVVIIILLKVVSWFRQEYGKNLIHLLSTVALSLAHPPHQWLKNAIALTENAWDYLSHTERYGPWSPKTLETFAFGHSLGGLIALSLPFALQNSPQSPFFPKQIVVADPAPSTEMGIPSFAIWILKLFRSPFTQDPLLIKDTGKSLTVPVAILHGGSDKLVPPQQWVGAAKGEPSNYEQIKSPHKSIYFSYSNPNTQPALVAFHNQAVTSTQYYGDGLFKDFGGVKHEPNAYNEFYIYPGVTKIFTETATPENLLDYLNPPNFEIKTTPPDVPSQLLTRLGWIVGIILLLAGGYWIFHTSLG